MVLKIKEFIKYFFNEILSMGIGWTAGLIAIQMLNNYFEKSGWINAWGFFSSKIVLSESTFMIVEWISTAFIGFIVMKIINKVIYCMLNNFETLKTKLNER